MYKILDDEERKLLKEITPWIIGTKRANENFAPIFKDNTPAKIIEKANNYFNIAKK